MRDDQALDYAKDVCARLGGDWKEVAGRSRTADVVRVRHAVMWILRDRADLSYPQIGRLFDRHHTAVIHAEAKIEGARRVNRQLAAALDAIPPPEKPTQGETR